MTYREDELRQGKSILDTAEKIWGWETPAGRIRLERRFELFFKYIADRKKILEIGCGTGLMTRKLADCGYDVTALDISPELLEKARERVGADNARFVCADLHELPLGDEMFEAVAGVSVLHHTRVCEVLRGIFRVLAPGGMLLLSEPNMLNPQIFLMKKCPAIGKMMHEVPGETAFIRKRLKKELETCGFIDVEVTPFDFLHPAIPQKLIPVFNSFTALLEKVVILKELSGSLFIRCRKPER